MPAVTEIASNELVRRILDGERDFSRTRLVADNLDEADGYKNMLAWLREQSDKSRRWDLMFIDPPTHSRSKRMDQDFDVQRDHVQLLTLAARMLAPDGVIVFSNNYTRFRLDRDALAAFAIDDIGRRTLPKDFERNPRIHSCYVLRPRNAADRVAGVTEISADTAGED